MTEQQENTSQVQKIIMVECIRQFFHKDIKDITMDSIAKSIGMSKRTLYENFSSKEILLEQTILYFSLHFKNHILAVSNPNNNSFVNMLTVLCESVYQISQYSRSKIEDVAHHYPNIAKALNKEKNKVLKDFFLKQIELAQQEGFITDNLEAEMVLNILFDANDKIFRENIGLLDKTYSKVEISLIRFFMILKGLTTDKGLEEYKKFFTTIEQLRSVAQKKNIFDIQ